MAENEKTNRMNEMFFENLSPTDFNSTVDRLSEEIEKRSWKISKDRKSVV